MTSVTTTTTQPTDHEERTVTDTARAADDRVPLMRRIRESLANPGVLFSLIWQVFLVYPVLAVLNADAPTVWTVLGLVSVAAFSVSYLVAFASRAAMEGFALELRSRRGEVHRAELSSGTLGLGHLAVLTAFAFGTAPAAGAHSVVTFLPFIACFVAAVWPLHASVPASLALLATGAVTAGVVGEPTLFIPAFLVIPIALSMIGTRLSVGMSEREGRLRRALGAAEERERVGRDLHDVLGHTLTALTIRAQLADRLVDADTAGAHRELRTIEDLTRTALSEMRQTVSGTRAADPEAELAVLGESLRSAGVDVDVLGAAEFVPDRHAALVAWTIREAGTNIIRHSGAGSVTIEFAPSGLRIADDGVGIESPRDAGGGAGGQGLAGLERRARDQGATVSVAPAAVPDAPAAVSDAPAAGTGTVVELRWT